MSGDGVLGAVVVGLRGIGRRHAMLLGRMEGFRLKAVCDLKPEVVEPCAQELGVRAYADFGEMLEKEKPEVVAVCTPNASHAPLTIQAAQAGVRGVYCEKPMAVNLGQARKMIEVCAERGVSLVINHQRRVGADLREARRLIEAGAIGEVMEWRGFCAGDVLSDGTHAVDSLLWLAGDPEVSSVAGHIHREVSSRGDATESAGYRYGHPVESAGWGLLRLKDGRPMELFCGNYQGRRAYQEYEVVGTLGRLWRVGDALCPNLFIQDARGGDREVIFDARRWHAYPVAAADGRGQWRAIELPRQGSAMEVAYERFRRLVLYGEAHPMEASVAIRGFECVMAIYESARLGRRVELPLRQEAFPLELMMAEGRA